MVAKSEGHRGCWKSLGEICAQVASGNCPWGGGFQKVAVCVLLILLCGCETLNSGPTYADRKAQEKDYLQFAQHQPIAHQEFALERYLSMLDLLACEKFNFEHRYLREMVTESENHRLGVGFCNDVDYFAKAERLTPEAAAQKVRQIVMKDDESRPSVYENEKRWPRIQAWYNAYNVKVQMDARPKVGDLEYYLFLRRQRRLDPAQAAQMSPLLDKEYQKYLAARYPSEKDKKKNPQAVTTPLWVLKLEVYRNALALLNSEGQVRPIVSLWELRACLNVLQTGFNEELAEKRRRTPNYQVDQNWYAAMNAQFKRIGSILKEIGTCETFEAEQNRRIALARDYNK